MLAGRFVSEVGVDVSIILVTLEGLHAGIRLDAVAHSDSTACLRGNANMKRQALTRGFTIAEMTDRTGGLLAKEHTRLPAPKGTRSWYVRAAAIRIMRMRASAHSVGQHCLPPTLNFRRSTASD